MDNGTYVIEPADGHSDTRVTVVNWAVSNLSTVLQETPGKARRPQVPRRT